MIEDDLHLPAAMLTRAVNVEMHGYGTKNSRRMLDVRDQRTKMSEPFLFAPHFVFSVRECNGMNIFQRPFGEHAESMDRSRILTLELSFHTAAFLQGDVNGCESIVQLQLFGEFVCDEKVMASSHPIIQLGKQKHVLVFQ